MFNRYWIFSYWVEIFFFVRKVYIPHLRLIFFMTKPKPVIPANVDPVKLADEIKGDMASEWLKRRESIKSKPLLVRQF